MMAINSNAVFFRTLVQVDPVTHLSYSACFLVFRCDGGVLTFFCRMPVEIDPVTRHCCSVCSLVFCYTGSRLSNNCFCLWSKSTRLPINVTVFVYRSLAIPAVDSGFPCKLPFRANHQKRNHIKLFALHNDLVTAVKDLPASPTPLTDAVVSKGSAVPFGHEGCGSKSNSSHRHSYFKEAEIGKAE
jgi:hypothetical protein